MTKIIAYSPDIYPVYLYVGSKDDLDEANEIFDGYDTLVDAANDEDPGTIVFDRDTTAATTVCVKEKNTGSIGLLVLIDFGKIEDMTSEVIAHESVHVADGMFDHLGLTKQSYKEGNEHYAYLVGWIAGSISNYIIQYKNGRKNKSKRS